MILSMTAFAHRALQDNWGHAVWEIRSVNHRYLEIIVKLPESLRELEPAVRELTRKKIQRGKLEIFLKYSPQISNQQAITVNTVIVKQLAQSVEQIQQLFPATNPASIIDILGWPGVMTNDSNSDEINTAILQSYDLTLTDLLLTRHLEGKAISLIISERIQQVQRLVNRIKIRLPSIMELQRHKLLARFAEIGLSLNTERLEQELVLLAQKIDICEEVDRLQMHTLEIQKNLQQTTSVGRHLDFLLQELQREANTLAAKSVDAETSTIAIDLRVLIEQMREQVQNVE